MVETVKACAAKLEDRRWSPRLYMVEGENPIPEGCPVSCISTQARVQPPIYVHMQTHTQTKHTHTHTGEISALKKK